jgi:hypothetical protein
VSTMNCLYCETALDEKTTDFSFKVMLCKKCASNANRLKNRIRSELEVVLAQLDETMRFALTARDMPGGLIAELSRSTLLKFIVHMDDRCRNKTPSSTSSRQSVTAANGERSSENPSAPD